MQKKRIRINDIQVIVKFSCVFFLLIILFLSFTATSQSPGGITSNNTLWLKPDIGLTSNATGAVTQWQELSGANATIDFTTRLLGSFPTQADPILLSAGINCNPYAGFDGITNSLSNLNSIPGTSAATFGTGFYMPSAFTPNGDMLNDVIKPHLAVGAQMVYFIFYNRWGQKVFSTNINYKGWDGNLTGKLQGTVVYTWLCKYTYMHGSLIDEIGSFRLLH